MKKAQARVAAATFDWEEASPESQQMNPEAVESMRAGLAARETKTLLVIRNDRIVCEWYAEKFGPNVRHFTASMVKALVGGLSLTLALGDGLVDVDDPVWKYVPAWKDHPEKSKITLKHLATHTSGIENAEGPGTVAEDPALIQSWKGVFWPDLKNHIKKPEWQSLVPPTDPFGVARDETRVLFEPGTDFHYSNPGIGMLSYALTAALQSTPYKDVRTYIRERVMRPIGVADEDWSIGYENIIGAGGTFMLDGLPIVENWGGASYTARATARVGRLMLRGGEWEGTRLIAEKWARAAIADAGLPGASGDESVTRASGLGWWINAKGRWASLPTDAFCGHGHHNQILLVVPSLQLIAVRNGRQLGDGLDDGLEPLLFAPLMASVAG